MILKEYINDKKRLFEELSKKSRLLTEKGPAYQNNIGYLISIISNILYFTQKFFMIIVIIINSMTLLEKKMEIAKFILHFHILKVTALNLKGLLVKIKKKDAVTIRLFDDYTKIQNVFMHNFNKRCLYGNNIYRDINLIFTYDTNNKQWYGTRTYY